MDKIITLEENLKDLIGMSLKECIEDRNTFMKKLNSLPTRESQVLVNYPKITDIIMGI